MRYFVLDISVLHNNNSNNNSNNNNDDDSDDNHNKLFDFFQRFKILIFFKIPI